MPRGRAYGSQPNRAAGSASSCALLGAAVLTHQQLLAALPSIALNLMMAGLFGATLRRHETPLIVRIAELDQGALTPEFARYLRALT